MVNSHSSRMIRVTRQRRASFIEATKLHKNLQAQDPCSSAVRLLITFLVDVFPHICLLLTPVLLMQYTYCTRSNYPVDPHTRFEASTCETTSSVWKLCFLLVESAFYVAMRIKLAYLQSIDPLEASLKAGGIMSRAERQYVWDNVMEAESSNITSYFETWFFGEKMKEISIDEIRDFVASVFFDGRNQEHLTDGELGQLDAFVEDALGRIQKQQCLESANNSDRKSTLQSSMSQITKTESDYFQGDQIQWEKVQAQRRLLQQMVPQAHNVPEAQLAQVLRNISMIVQETIQQPEDDLSVISTCSSVSTCLASPAEPGTDSPKRQSRNFACPFDDPIQGVRIFPLFIQLPFFLLIEIAMRVVLWRAGFQRHRVVGTTYYFHPGNTKNGTKAYGARQLPIVFMHGLGIGQIFYLSLIYEMLKTGRPIFLPEISSVSACRPWVLPGSIQSPHHVAASLSTMLSRHGFVKATFAAHSYGTFWMAYMTKYAPGFVAASVFLDPVCFSLHHSYLTQRMVYNDADPGDVAFIVIADMMVNWSIQRIGWARANLFVQDLRNKPCAIFLSGKDRVAPSAIQEAYLREHGGANVMDFDGVSRKDFETTDLLSVFVFRGDDHGDWAVKPRTSPCVVECIEALCTKAEEIDNTNELRRRQSDHYSMRSSMIVLSGFHDIPDRAT